MSIWKCQPTGGRCKRCYCIWKGVGVLVRITIMSVVNLATVLLGCGSGDAGWPLLKSLKIEPLRHREAVRDTRFVRLISSALKSPPRQPVDTIGIFIQPIWSFQTTTWRRGMLPDLCWYLDFYPLSFSIRHPTSFNGSQCYHIYFNNISGKVSFQCSVKLKEGAQFSLFTAQNGNFTAAISLNGRTFVSLPPYVEIIRHLWLGNIWTFLWEERRLRNRLGWLEARCVFRGGS